LDQDLANLVVEMSALQAMVHKMRATSTAFDNVIIFPSIDMDSRYKKVKLEIQFFEDTPVASLQYSLGSNMYVIESGLFALGAENPAIAKFLDLPEVTEDTVYDTVISASTEKVLEALFSLQQIAHSLAYDIAVADMENDDSDDDSTDDSTEDSEDSDVDGDLTNLS
jgi:hypothetical protein